LRRGGLVAALLVTAGLWGLRRRALRLLRPDYASPSWRSSAPTPWHG